MRLHFNKITLQMPKFRSVGAAAGRFVRIVHIFAAMLRAMAQLHFFQKRATIMPGHYHAGDGQYPDKNKHYLKDSFQNVCKSAQNLIRKQAK